MSEASHPHGRLVRPGVSCSRPGAARRCFPITILGLLTAAALLFAPAAANADTPSTLTVVGTSDVSDSGLMQNLIQPQFQSAFPQYSFKYTGTATGTAISNAESGAGGPSVLIVHAASLENQFVANGFSFEQYGRALFTNDFVLAGPNGDPAGVAGNAANNIAQAFADIAAAGIGGRATFVSRGGTPGTTVEEHQIWALVGASASPPAGLLLCAVNSTSGGGETPIAPGNGVTASGQPCPGGGALPSSSQLPPWYVTTGLTQGPNVVAANACNAFPTGPNSCYVLSDRGTFDYLASGSDPAGSIPGLKIVTRGPQSASAPGGVNALINYFHGYIINPSKPGETVNLPAATAFLNFITSPGLQAQLKNYLANTSDPAGPPFVADASPIIIASKIPGTFHAGGKKVTVTGTVTNAQPGFPAPAGKAVNVDEVVGGLSLHVATAKTNAAGAYTIRFAPTATGSYEVTTPQIAQIEIPTLTPVFGDLLSPGSTSPVKVKVRSAVTSLRVRPTGGQAVVIGSVAPGTKHVKATVQVFARRAGAKRGFREISKVRLSVNDGNFAVAKSLSAHRWQIKVEFRDGRQVVESTSRTVTFTVPAKPATSVSVRSLKVSKHAALTLAARVRSSTGGGKVQLLGLNTAAGRAARFGVFATATVRRGKVTLRARLRHGNRYVLQLKYISKGQALSYSGLRTTTVK